MIQMWNDIMDGIVQMGAVMIAAFLIWLIWKIIYEKE